MTFLDVSTIADWHAHVYFDADTRDAAMALRAEIDRRFAGKLTLGRFHERPVGPHPKWSFQLALQRSALLDVIDWLVLNHGALDVFIHPNTGNGLRDHRDSAMWIGRSHELSLDGFSG